MRTIAKIFAVAGTMSVALANSALAFDWDCPPVPEFDGASSIAVIALLLSLGAILRSDVKR